MRSARKTEEPASPLKRRSQHLVRGFVEGDEADVLDVCRRCSDGRDCDLCCLVGREPVYASGDGRKGDAASADLIGHLKAAPVARRQDLSLTVAATFPYGTNGVNDMAYRWVQVERGRGYRIARIAWRQRGTCLGQSRSCRTMNCPIYTPATQQRLIRCGDDGVDALAGDVAKNNFDHRHCLMMPPGRFLGGTRRRQISGIQAFVEARRRQS